MYTLIHPAPQEDRQSQDVVKPSCSTEVGITVGVIILLECLVAMVITLIMVTCWWR